MDAAYSVGIAFLPDDGSEPDELAVTEIGWPFGCPVPRLDESFIWEDRAYEVVDVQYTPCGHHDVPMIHILLCLGGRVEDVSGMGTEIKLP